MLRFEKSCSMKSVQAAGVGDEEAAEPEAKKKSKKSGSLWSTLFGGSSKKTEGTGAVTVRS